MKNTEHYTEEHNEEFDPDEVYRQMLELYTMLPPFPFRKKPADTSKEAQQPEEVCPDQDI